jgi:hypothetical protein
VWLAAAAVNGLMAGVNLVPFRAKVGNASLQTDGMLILQTLRSGTFQATGPMIIQSCRFFRSLWRSIGDDLRLRSSLLGSAVAYVQLDDLERAEVRRLEAESLPAPIMPALRALDSVLRASIALGTSRLEDAALALDAAQVSYRSIGHEVGLLLVSSLQASARAVRGDAPGASADLEGLMAEPLMKRHPSLRVALLVSCLGARAAMSDIPEVVKLLNDYEGTRRALRTASLDRQVYKTVARLDAQRGDWVSAEPAYRKVVSAIGEIASAWADPDDRIHFLRCNATILAEARQCLESLGKADEAVRLLDVNALLAEFQQRAEAARQRDRRFRRTGLWIMLVNVAPVVGSFGLAQLVEPETRIPLLILAAVFLAFTSPGILFILLHLTIGRLFSVLDRRSGAVTLLLACLPWLSVFVIVLMIAIMVLLDLKR